MKTIILGSDHAGWQLKNKIKQYLSNYVIKDVSQKLVPGDDYPDYAKLVAKKVLKEGKGILICGSGIGMSIGANRFKGIRAALCRTVKEAEYSRKDNNSNILCLGAKFNIDKPEDILETWLSTKFEGGRHIKRIKKLD